MVKRFIHSMILRRRVERRSTRVGAPSVEEVTLSAEEMALSIEEVAPYIEVKGKSEVGKVGIAGESSPSPSVVVDSEDIYAGLCQPPRLTTKLQHQKEYI